jgi:uncharacterized protein YcaQ
MTLAGMGVRGRNFNHLSLDEARRAALAAQGFDRPRPARPSGRHIRETIRRLGLVQVDCVNVVVPAHYQVMYSRLGPYDRAVFDRVAYRSGEFTEQWAHEASIIPVETWPLLRHRMTLTKFANWGFVQAVQRHPEYIEWVVEQVRERGPLGADQLPPPDGAGRRIPGTWVGTIPRGALEIQFIQGVLATVERRSDFSRVFDLAERRIPVEHFHRKVDREEAERELLRTAARGHAVATAKDLADYFRMKVGVARPRIAELVKAGDLVEVGVDGWRETAYLHRDAEIPKQVEAASLISPFDPLIWTRPRVARLFGFDYRVEIFVPERQRKWGFYVLPFLLGDRLVARVDLKADRSAGRLLVKGAWGEERSAEALAVELGEVARWLGLERVVVGRKGDLASRLRAATSSRR